MKRTFIAVKITPGEKLKEVRDQFRVSLSRDNVKWVDPGSMHITLCFLGDTTEGLIPGMIKEIEHAAGMAPAIKLTFRGCGVFRNIHDPRVLWIGMERSETFTDLKRRLDEALKPFGFIPEKRDFRPHLTLARIKRIQDVSILEDLLQEFEGEPVQESEIKEVIFYESILRPAGPEYIPLLKARLGRAAP